MSSEKGEKGGAAVAHRVAFESVTRALREGSRRREGVLIGAAHRPFAGVVRRPRSMTTGLASDGLPARRDEGHSAGDHSAPLVSSGSRPEGASDGVAAPQQQQQQLQSGHHAPYSPSRFPLSGDKAPAALKVRDCGDDVAQPDLFAQLGVDMVSISAEELAQRLVPSVPHPQTRITTSDSHSSLTNSEHTNPDRVYDDEDSQQMAATMHVRLRYPRLIACLFAPFGSREVDMSFPLLPFVVVVAITCSFMCVLTGAVPVDRGVLSPSTSSSRTTPNRASLAPP